MTADVKKTSAGLILVAWLIVGVPATWGIYNTVLNAKKLFTAPPVAAATPNAAAPAK